MLAAKNAIEAVVSAHNCPRFCCFDGDLKATQINLSKRAIIHNGVHVHAAQFLIVHGKVLQARAHTLRLNTVDQIRGDMPIEKWIFGKIFKITTA